jgi:hypothetical protein
MVEFRRLWLYQSTQPAGMSSNSSSASRCAQYRFNRPLRYFKMPKMIAQRLNCGVNRLPPGTGPRCALRPRAPGGWFLSWLCTLNAGATVLAGDIDDLVGELDALCLTETLGRLAAHPVAFEGEKARAV